MMTATKRFNIWRETEHCDPLNPLAKDYLPEEIAKLQEQKLGATIQ